MRITNNMLISNMMSNLNNNLRRMDKVQQQFSSGKKFQLPSDDPIGVSKSLKLHTDVSKIEQYQRNAKDAASWLDITEMSLDNIGDILKRTKELTIQASTDTYGENDLKQIAAEIDQHKQELIKIANTTYAGRSIFTGFKTDQKLLAQDGNYIPVALDANEISEYNVGVADSIKINTVGTRIFGTTSDAANFDTLSVDNTHKSYLVDVFDRLKSALDTEDKPGIRDMVAEVDKCFNNNLANRAIIGAKMNRLELTENRLESESINFTKLLSDNEDADMSKVIMDMKIEENVYRASLSSGARIIQPTLIDFLR